MEPKNTMAEQLQNKMKERFEQEKRDYDDKVRELESQI